MIGCYIYIYVATQQKRWENSIPIQKVSQVSRSGKVTVRFVHNGGKLVSESNFYVLSIDARFVCAPPDPEHQDASVLHMLTYFDQKSANFPRRGGLGLAVGTPSKSWILGLQTTNGSWLQVQSAWRILGLPVLAPVLSRDFWRWRNGLQGPRGRSGSMPQFWGRHRFPEGCPKGFGPNIGNHFKTPHISFMVDHCFPIEMAISKFLVWTAVCFYRPLGPWHHCATWVWMEMLHNAPSDEDFSSFCINMGLPKHGLLQSTVVYHEFYFFLRGVNPMSDIQTISDLH